MPVSEYWGATAPQCVCTLDRQRRCRPVVDSHKWWSATHPLSSYRQCTTVCTAHAATKASHNDPVSVTYCIQGCVQVLCGLRLIASISYASARGDHSPLLFLLEHISPRLVMNELLTCRRDLEFWLDSRGCASVCLSLRHGDTRMTDAITR